MAWRDQQAFIEALEKQGELIRINTYVDPHLEIAEITDRISKSGGGGKALLFENTGTGFPVLMNAYGSEKRMCMALGVDSLDSIAKEIEAAAFTDRADAKSLATKRIGPTRSASVPLTPSL